MTEQRRTDDQGSPAQALEIAKRIMALSPHKKHALEALLDLLLDLEGRITPQQPMAK